MKNCINKRSELRATADKKFRRFLPKITNASLYCRQIEVRGTERG